MIPNLWNIGPSLYKSPRLRLYNTFWWKYFRWATYRSKYAVNQIFNFQIYRQLTSLVSNLLFSPINLTWRKRIKKCPQYHCSYLLVKWAGVSPLLNDLSSKWTSPYTRRLSRLLDSSSSKGARPIYLIGFQVNGPGPSSRWAVRVNGTTVQNIGKIRVALPKKTRKWVSSE